MKKINALFVMLIGLGLVFGGTAPVEAQKKGQSASIQHGVVVKSERGWNRRSFDGRIVGLQAPPQRCHRRSLGRGNRLRYEHPADGHDVHGRGRGWRRQGRH